MTNDVTAIRELIHGDTWWDVVITKDEAREITRRILEIANDKSRQNDPSRSDDNSINDLIGQLTDDELDDWVDNFPTANEKQAVLDKLAGALDGKQLARLAKSFGAKEVAKAVGAHATQQTKIDFGREFIKDKLAASNVSTGSLREINDVLAALGPAERNQIIAGLSDKQIEKWMDEVDGAIGGLPGEEKRQLFDLLTKSLDKTQLARIAKTVAAERPEFLKELHEAVLAHGGAEEKKAYINTVAKLLPMEFVKTLKDPTLVAAFIDAQDLNNRDGFERALTAYASLGAQDIAAFVTQHRETMGKFSVAVQAHQDWYEELTVDVITTHGEGQATVKEAAVVFSKEQLAAMRAVFLKDDGMYTNGELLLAFPDRVERNEAVTPQYMDLSTDIGLIIGDDFANWATLGAWASDEIGYNLVDWRTGAIEQTRLGDSRFWLSKGNTKLASDISPAFRHFIDTYKNGANRDMSFEDFWKSLETKYGGRGISYLEGGETDPAGIDPSPGKKDDMKNAFKAYHEAMLLQDKRHAGTATLADDKRRGQLMFYGNTLIGLQEQRLIQQDVANGLKVGNVTNPFGWGAPAVNVHVPEGKLNMDLDVPESPYAITDLNAMFVTADGKQINIGQALGERINGLHPNDEDELDRTNSGTNHWERYHQRMGYIYHFFASRHMDQRFIHTNPLETSRRAEALDNTPGPIYRMA